MWSETPIQDTSCCCHPLTGVPYLRPGPCRAVRELRFTQEEFAAAGEDAAASQATLDGFWAELLSDLAVAFGCEPASASADLPAVSLTTENVASLELLLDVAAGGSVESEELCAWLAAVLATSSV